MSLDLIPSASIKVLFSSTNPPLNEILSYGVDYFARCSEKRADLSKRFDAFKGHAPLFAQCETTLDIFELLWLSASASGFASDFFSILRQVIDELPANSRDTLPSEEPKGLLNTVAIPIIVFIAKRKLKVMMPNLCTKAYGSSGWMYNNILRDHLLIAAITMDDLRATNEMLGRFIKQEQLLESLEFENFLMLCCAYTAGTLFFRNVPSIQIALERLDILKTRYENHFRLQADQQTTESLSRRLINEKLDEISSVLEDSRTSGEFEEKLHSAVFELINSISIMKEPLVDLKRIMAAAA